MEMRDFFISYTKANEAEALWIAKTLEEHGYSAYIQARDIVIGDDFLQKMEEYLNDSRNFIAVCSEKYFHSKFAIMELHAAVVAQKKNRMGKIFPVFIEPYSLPDLYAPLVHVDLYELSEAEKTQRLLKAISHRDTDVRQLPARNSATNNKDTSYQEHTISRSKVASQNNLEPWMKDIEEIIATSYDEGCLFSVLATIARECRRNRRTHFTSVTLKENSEQLKKYSDSDIDYHIKLCMNRNFLSLIRSGMNINGEYMIQDVSGEGMSFLRSYIRKYHAK